MLIVHNTGEAAKTSRTTAVATHNARPVAGFSAAYLHEPVRLQNVIVSDISGTSSTSASWPGGVRFYQFNPIIDRWKVNVSMIETKAIGAGGDPSPGSTTYKTVQIGPHSAGSMPGPAAFDIGGTEPT